MQQVQDERERINQIGRDVAHGVRDGVPALLAPRDDGAPPALREGRHARLPARLRLLQGEGTTFVSEFL